MEKDDRKKWAHPFNQYGQGPVDPLYVAQDVRGIGSDPYRSLAWLVRKKGGYKKTDIPFADFQWGQLFRKHDLLSEKFDLDYKSAQSKAMKIARSKQAAKLPGYIKKK